MAYWEAGYTTFSLGHFVAYETITRELTKFVQFDYLILW